ncbi:hypothetical protein JNB62_01755 [Microbacterium jejuense]|uniref:Transcriptional regulator, AbiEi antitoxin, Type IV TA system n=1 Tax=Microbacterium jejuense TaxID=1263637 RepID=A0ABS7HHL2_9MICO|nr:hypothetical protein [Microbacterium jejuense]MBW9092401.1 hypothetical protein [Microbacterium jejuense]
MSTTCVLADHACSRRQRHACSTRTCVVGGEWRAHACGEASVLHRTRDFPLWGEVSTDARMALIAGGAGCQCSGMPRHVSIEQAKAVVLTRERLDRERWKDREIAAALADGTLLRLQRNRYVLDADWADLWPESRHRVEVAAVCGEMGDGGGVIARESAAVIWDLPLYRHTPGAVHVVAPRGQHSHSRVGLQRHTEALPEADTTVRGDIRVTTLERTVLDVARTLPLEAAVAAADAALRQIAFIGGQYDIDAAEAWREGMRARAARATGSRGVRQAIAVIEFADGRAESPIESVGRVQLWRLGFVRVRLQVPVAGPNGKDLHVDLEIEDVESFLEIDGRSKYEDEALRSGRTIEQVVLDEKRREDWIRGTTQKRVVRAEEAHVATADALRRRLAAFGIRSPR